jgi:radical SAM protein with 4Fe4S-binding SPASM domain
MKLVDDSERIVLADNIPLDKPLVIYLFPVNKCNLLCEFCEYQSSNRPINHQSMSFDTVQKLMDGTRRDFGAIKQIIISGSGEPLMHPDIASIVALAKAVAHKVRIITNGTLLNHKLSQALIMAGLDEITISVNGLNDDDYIKYTGRKINFDNYVGNIRYLFEHKAQMQVHVKIINYMVKSEKSRQRFFDTFQCISDKTEIHSLMELFDTINYQKMRGEDENIKFETNALNVPVMKYMPICSQPFYNLSVHENGDVSPCCGVFSDKGPVLGNITSESIDSIWRKSLRLQYRMLNGRNGIVKCATCTNCKFTINSDKDIISLEAAQKRKSQYSQLI